MNDPKEIFKINRDALQYYVTYFIRVIKYNFKSCKKKTFTKLHCFILYRLIYISFIIHPSSKSLSTTQSPRFNRRDALSSITTLDQDIYDSESTSSSETHLLVEFKDRSFDILPETSLYDDVNARDLTLDEFYNFNYHGLVKMAKVKKIGKYILK